MRTKKTFLSLITLAFFWASTSPGVLKTTPANQVADQKHIGQGYQICTENVMGQKVPVDFAPNGGVNALHTTAENPTVINVTMDEKFEKNFGSTLESALNDPKNGLNAMTAQTGAPRFKINASSAQDSAYTQLHIKCNDVQGYMDEGESVVYQAANLPSRIKNKKKETAGDVENQYDGIIFIDCGSVGNRQSKVLLQHEFLHQFGLGDMKDKKDKDNMMFSQMGGFTDMFKSSPLKRDLTDADLTVVKQIYAKDTKINLTDCKDWCAVNGGGDACKKGIVGADVVDGLDQSTGPTATGAGSGTGTSQTSH